MKVEMWSLISCALRFMTIRQIFNRLTVFLIEKKREYIRVYKAWNVTCHERKKERIFKFTYHTYIAEFAIASIFLLHRICFQLTLL